jgi:hypothetical protein
MRTNIDEKLLPPYFFRQKVRCTIASAPKDDELNPTRFKYLVSLPGDRRQGVLSSDDPNLQPGIELEVAFTSYFGKRLMFNHSSESVTLDTITSEEEIKFMSLPVHGSLVSVTVVEKSDDGYIAEFKDCWDDTIKGSLASSESLEIGESLDAAVTGWSPDTINFISVREVEKEIERKNARSRYLTGKDFDNNSDDMDMDMDMELEMDWMSAVTSLSNQSESRNDTLQPMRDEAEALIEKLLQDGLSKHWDATVVALKIYAYPKENEEISNLLKQLVETHSEKEVIEFLTYRLHPDKECPLTPTSRNILLSLRSPSPSGIK